MYKKLSQLCPNQRRKDSGQIHETFPSITSFKFRIVKQNWGNPKEHTVQLIFSDLPPSDFSRSLQQTKFALEQFKFIQQYSKHLLQPIHFTPQTPCSIHVLFL